MTNPYDPYPGQQPQPPNDAAAPTQFVPLGGQPPQVPPQPGYGAPQNSGGWAAPQQPGQSPYEAPPQQQPQPQYGMPPQQQPGWGAPPPQPQQSWGAPQTPQQQAAPGWGAAPQPPQQQAPAWGAPQQQPQGQPFGAPQPPFGGYPVAPANAPRSGGAKFAATVFGTVLGRLIVVVVGLAVAGTVIYTTVGGHSAKRDGNGQVSQSGSLGIGDLKTGDCFNAPSGDSGIESVNAIPCTNAHDSQVYAEPKITESSYPDSTTLGKEAQDDCNNAGSAVTPAPPSDVQIAYYAAQDSTTFNQGFDYIICALQSPSKDLTQSFVSGS